MMKNKWKEKTQKLRNFIMQIFAVGYTVMSYGMNSYALQNSIYVTGTKKLFADGLAAVQIVAAAVFICLIAFWELKKRLSEDNEEGSYNKKQKGTFIALIFVETLSTAIGVLGGYYGVSIK